MYLAASVEIRIAGVPWHHGLVQDSRIDPLLEAEGDNRNVTDEFRNWTVEAIREELDARAAQFAARTGMELHVAIENWGHDFNIGSVVRTANAMGVRHVHIVGRKRWNRRGAMVTDRYLHIHHHADVESLVAMAQDEYLTIVGIDNVPGSQPLENWQPPQRALFIFGEESAGLSDQARQVSTTIRHITQFGSTRSINAGAAAAIAMYHWGLVSRRADGVK